MVDVPGVVSVPKKIRCLSRDETNIVEERSGAFAISVARVVRSAMNAEVSSLYDFPSTIVAIKSSPKLSKAQILDCVN